MEASFSALDGFVERAGTNASPIALFDKKFEEIQKGQECLAMWWYFCW